MASNAAVKRTGGGRTARESSKREWGQEEAIADPIKKSSYGGDTKDLLKGLISVENALEIARGLVVPITESESLPVRQAVGRVLAENILAPRAMPFFDNSAMDGFAVRTCDLDGDGPYRLPLLGAVAAGMTPQPFDCRWGSYRIFTGAPVPFGFDAVVMQERCTVVGEAVSIACRPKIGENIRRRGEDIAESAELVSAGTTLTARHIGLLAANGIASVAVRRKIRVAILSSGDELVRGADLKDAASIFDANGPMLEALCAGPMLDCEDRGILPDDRKAMISKLGELASCYDLIVSSGSASTGGRDFLRDALIDAGGTLEAHRVALKPGKPVFFGRLGSALFTGLPGNPFAAYIGFRLFVAAQIAALAGVVSRSHRKHRAIWGRQTHHKSGRTEYLPVRVVRMVDGLPVIEPVGHGGSASLYPLAQADGLTSVPADCESLDEGQTVFWTPFEDGAAPMGVF